MSTETEYTSSDPYTLTCVLLSLEILLHDNPRAKELFAPYLSRVIPNMLKATVYHDTDIISLQVGFYNYPAQICMHKIE